MANETREYVPVNDHVTDDQYVIILEFCSFMYSVMSSLGLVCNIINVTTFIVMGLRDGVTVSFLFLSFFDLSFLLMSFCMGVLIGLNIIELKYSLRFEIEPHGLFVFFAHVMVLINVTNTLTTTFLSVTRCMCVARPLQFKNSFSRSRTIIVNFAFIVFAVTIYTPILANMGMLPTTDLKTNKTRPTLWVSKNRKAIKDAVWVVINSFLPLLTEVVIIICVFVMARSLRNSSKFRDASTLSPGNVAPPKKEKNFPEDSPNSNIKIVEKSKRKDKRVVQQVILISVVYIICNMPKILLSIVGIIEPQFTVDGLYKNLCLSSHCLQKLFEILNASVNTLIYYSYNTKFRTKLRELVNTICSNDSNIL